MKSLGNIQNILEFAPEIDFGQSIHNSKIVLLKYQFQKSWKYIQNIQDSRHGVSINIKHFFFELMSNYQIRAFD